MFLSCKRGSSTCFFSIDRGASWTGRSLKRLQASLLCSLNACVISFTFPFLQPKLCPTDHLKLSQSNLVLSWPSWKVNPISRTNKVFPNSCAHKILQKFEWHLSLSSDSSYDRGLVSSRGCLDALAVRTPHSTCSSSSSRQFYFSL